MLSFPTFNTAGGTVALGSNTTGDGNSAFGWRALAENTTGSRNTAMGALALDFHSNATNSTAVGYDTLDANTTGNNNTAIGFTAGTNATTGSDNIYINNSGVAAESNTIRIGGGPQTRAFIDGIRGVTTGIANAVTVRIDSNGQLGTINSSRRFKEAIEDMGDVSSGLLQLRPVTFRYKETYADGEHPVQPGLIAEEVAEVYPDMVVHDSEGEIETVQYHKLIPMLLNELQKQERKINELMDRLSLLESERALNVAQTN